MPCTPREGACQQGTGPHPQAFECAMAQDESVCSPHHPGLLPPLCHTHTAVGPCGPAPTTAEGRFSWGFLLRLGHRPPEAELGRNRGKNTFCSKWHLTERFPHMLPSTWIPTHPLRRLGATTSGLESISPDTPGHAFFPRGSRELPARPLQASPDVLLWARRTEPPPQGGHKAV